MKKAYMFMKIVFVSLCCIAQKDYSQYYREKYNFYNVNSKEDYQNFAVTRIQNAFKKNTPLPYDLLIISHYYYQNRQTIKGKRFLLKAASSGLGIENTQNYPYIDSTIDNNEKIKKKYIKRYENSLRKCDIETSLNITSMFERDQNYRAMCYKYSKDTNFSKYFWKETVNVDSVNYFSIMEIINSSTFDSRRLTYDAKLNFAVILMHNATNSFANPDTVFSLLKGEVLKGVVSPEFYMNTVDRYYMTFGYNYYCNFYDDALPIYDIMNVDLRRSEMWLYPLYYKFKWNNKLDKLPNDYKYDFDTIR